MLQLASSRRASLVTYAFYSYIVNSWECVYVTWEILSHPDLYRLLQILIRVRLLLELLLLLLMLVECILILCLPLGPISIHQAYSHYYH